MKNFFKPEDFEFPAEGANLHVANICNEKLNEFIESWPVVYGSVGAIPKPYVWSINKITTDTHSARLAFIKEIKKEPCKHEPDNRGWVSEYDGFVLCKHCGVKLKSVWVEDKND